MDFMENKILVVDDDRNICQLIGLYLKKEGYTVKTAGDGEAALSMIKAEIFDLVLLDVMMPKKDGFETLKEVRKFSDIPVIMLTARSETIDRIKGLDAGADDYIPKPFEPQELILRIKAILRRTGAGKNDDINCGGLFISLATYTVKLNNKTLEMTPKEIELLYMLASNPGTVFTRDDLFKALWSNANAKESRSIDVHIKRLREKLGENAEWRLTTVWGIGYKFERD